MDGISDADRRNVHGGQAGTIPGIFGGGQTGQYLRRGAESVHFTVGGEPVGQAAGGAAAGPALLAQHARRQPDERGQAAARIREPRARPAPERRGKDRRLAAAADRRADHRRERHGYEDLSALPARGVPQGLSRHPHPHPEWHDVHGARLPSCRAGGYCVRQRSAGRDGLQRAALRRHAYDLRRRAGLSGIR